jgi:hypothetical protein
MRYNGEGLERIVRNSDIDVDCSIASLADARSTFSYESTRGERPEGLAQSLSAALFL